ncbi:MAG TPA: ribosome assembly RNA-binding protein YhbY [Erysipelotrichaceae bacterium]|nr:ribosome assembly RNA-binding protein YhbY [Erysipelotrichaceae bacterium]
MLTTKQKAYLRSLAQTERPIFQVGKDSISDNLVKTVSDALRVRELIKVSILKNAPGDVKEIAFDLARLTKSELIQVIGRQVVLYKKAKEPKILLP